MPTPTLLQSSNGANPNRYEGGNSVAERVRSNTMNTHPSHAGERDDAVVVVNNSNMQHNQSLNQSGRLNQDQQPPHSHTTSGNRGHLIHQHQPKRQFCAYGNEDNQELTNSYGHNP